MELATARANNRKVSATFVPGNLNELLMCFDFARSLPETNALQNGMRKKSGKMIMDAERDGQSEDVCTYVKADLGMMMGGEIGPTGDALPRPDILLLVLHRLLHLHEVVRADPPQVRLRDGDAARALPGRGKDRAQHARLRGQAAEGDGDPDARAHLGRQVRHRPAAPVHARVGQGRGRPGRGAAVGEAPAEPDRRLLRRGVLHRADLHRVSRHARSHRVLPRAARRDRGAHPARQGPGHTRRRHGRREVPPDRRRPAQLDELPRLLEDVLRRGRGGGRRPPTPRSAACTTSASATTRTIRSNRWPSTAWAATPT